MRDLSTGFTSVESFYGLDIRYYEITKEEYQRMLIMDKKDLNKEIENALPQSIVIGYGYYGYHLMHNQDGKYYLCVKIGNTAD